MTNRTIPLAPFALVLAALVAADGSRGAETPASSPHSTAPGHTGTVAPAEAQRRLLEGNRRYVEAQASHTNQTAARRTGLARTQHPFAVVVGCADSRVPPEILFDQGLGDLFVIRLAGNILDDAVLASVEYAVAHLDVRYVMILGHERCGAVTAVAAGGEAEGHVSALVKAIQPAVDKVRGEPGDLVENAVLANIALVAGQVRSAQPILANLVRRGELAVVGARYDLDDGKVTILP